jgi:hypothetical protein
MSVGREPSLGGGGPRSDVELEHIAVTALTDVRRLLCAGCGERDGGTPELADRALRLPRRQLYDEDPAVRSSLLEVQERVGFGAGCLEMRQQVHLGFLRDPTGIRHEVAELGKVSGECLTRRDATTAFVVLPTLPGHIPNRRTALIREEPRPVL